MHVISKRFELLRITHLREFSFCLKNLLGLILDLFFLFVTFRIICVMRFFVEVLSFVVKLRVFATASEIIACASYSLCEIAYSYIIFERFHDNCKFFVSKYCNVSAA